MKSKERFTLLTLVSIYTFILYYMNAAINNQTNKTARDSIKQKTRTVTIFFKLLRLNYIQRDPV